MMCGMRREKNFLQSRSEPPEILTKKRMDLSSCKDLRNFQGDFWDDV